MVDKQKIKNLPTSPGVYLMHDSEGKVIYVGKAVVLKNRVSQYFNNSPKQKKVEAMVSNIADFSYVITLTESDALALESNLIKKYKPYYNILLKDDKSDPYIKINLTEEYPSIEITRKLKNDKNKYFGPYFNGIRAKDVVEVARTVFGIRYAELLLRPRYSNVGKPSLLRHLLRLGVVFLGRENIVLHSRYEYNGKFKSLCRVNGHKNDCVSLVVSGINIQSDTFCI